MLYFDCNATAPLAAVGRQAWLDATERFVGNASSPHRLGARADAALENARGQLAAWLGCDPEEIVWTSGATESNNAVIHHVAQQSAGEMWMSAIEHPSVFQAAAAHFFGRTRLIPVTSEGVADVAWLEAELERSQPALIAVMAANNETGVLQPWREVAGMCAPREIPLLCDAAQWAGKQPAHGLGACAYVTGCAHKSGGPQGVGFMKCPAQLTPLLRGGGQEGGRRAGTENLPGVLAMIAVLEERENALRCGGVRERIDWRAAFETELLARLPGAAVVGANAERLWNTVSAVMPRVDCRQRWVVKLDKLGFAVSTGSACASGSEKPSHVLAAMDFSPESASRVLRFSSAWETRPGSWMELLEGIQRAAAELALR